jgi:hypothetical protein
MIAIFWTARMLGSPWHPLSTYLGACAPVFLALAMAPAVDLSRNRTFISKTSARRTPFRSTTTGPAVFWTARMLGSPWHPLSTYLGACAPVFLALASQADQ